MQGAFLGPEYSDTEIEKASPRWGAKFKKFSEKNAINEIAEALSKG